MTDLVRGRPPLWDEGLTRFRDDPRSATSSASSGPRKGPAGRGRKTGPAMLIQPLVWPAELEGVFDALTANAVARALRGLGRDQEAAAQAAVLRLRAQRLWAAANGFAIAKTAFSTHQLAEGRVGATAQRDWEGSTWPACPGFGYPFWDHYEWYRERARPFRPAAVIVHSYHDLDGCSVEAHTQFLIQSLPESWYYPGCATAFVVRRRPVGPPKPPPPSGRTWPAQPAVSNCPEPTDRNPLSP